MWWWLACAKDDPPKKHHDDPSGETSGTITDVPISTDTEPPDPTTTVEPVPTDPSEVCFPGPNETWDLCLPVAGLDATPIDYSYPDPLYGSEQYLAPVRYLWLDDVDGKTKLAANFVLEEFSIPEKGPWGVVQPHAVASVQGIRDELGALIVNSGYRSPAYNATVGGATWSRHLYGDGFDLVAAGATLAELADACDAHGAAYVGVYEAHIHCDWRDDPLEPAFFPVSGVARSAITPRPELSAAIEDAGGWWTAPAEGWDEGEPLRVWRAYDADGALLEEWEGREYQPPAEATRIEVEIGRALTVSRAVP